MKNMKDYKWFIFLFIVLFVFSCKKSESPEDQVQSDIRFRYFNLEKQGWKSKMHTQLVDSIHYTATEVPIQYYLLKDLGNTDLIKVDSLYEANKRERVIEFTFEQINGEDLLREKFTSRNYQKSVEYMSFGIENDFIVVTSKNDTIKCSGALFERTFKVAPKNKLLLFFSGIDPNDKIQLIYQDKLFNSGTLKFRFKDSTLKL